MIDKEYIYFRKKIKKYSSIEDFKKESIDLTKNNKIIEIKNKKIKNGVARNN